MANLKGEWAGGRPACNGCAAAYYFTKAKRRTFGSNRKRVEICLPVGTETRSGCLRTPRLFHSRSSSILVMLLLKNKYSNDNTI